MGFVTLPPSSGLQFAEGGGGLLLPPSTPGPSNCERREAREPRPVQQAYFGNTRYLGYHPSLVGERAKYVSWLKYTRRRTAVNAGR